jgi:hypothetical protein
MRGGIFLIQDDGQLIEMSEQKYDSEELLQELLAKYPNLLAGDQMDTTSPRRWLLISRELGVPSEEEGGGRWSLDHLFLDQDGIPTLVEVKRSNDTRLRREVVGQMLDYAANAIAYWPVETIRTKFEARCEAESTNGVHVITDFLGHDVNQEEFWQKVKTNLQAGKVRLVFVADEIPSELRRVVEFLNEQMDPAEVLAVEISQFVGESLKTLVPRVIGQTEEAQRKKSGTVRTMKQWDEKSFFQDLEERRGKSDAKIARAVLDWAKSKSLRVHWGKGGVEGTYYPVLDHKGKANKIFGVYSPGKIEVNFQSNPLEKEEQKLELMNRLNAIDGVAFQEKHIHSWGSFPISILKEESRLKDFFAIFEWVIEEIKKS